LAALDAEVEQILAKRRWLLDQVGTGGGQR
jgi:hypothetical protein